MPQGPMVINRDELHLGFIDLNGNEVRNVRAQLLASDPGVPAEGQFWYNTTEKQLKYRTDAATIIIGTGMTTEEVQDIVGNMMFNNVETGINVTYNDVDGEINFVVSLSYIEGIIENMVSASGEEVGITVSFDTGTGTLDFVVHALNLLPAPTGDLSLNSNKIVSLLDGTADSDAATLGQVRALNSGFDFKGSARASVATNVNTANPGTAVFDGVTLANGELLLLTGQTTPAQNGLWVFNGSGSALTRPANFDSDADVTPGAIVVVEEGTLFADTVWILTTNGPITLGTTGLTFVQLPMPTTAGGNGLTKTGNVLDVNVDGTTIELSGDAVRIAASAAGSGLTGGGGSALAVDPGLGIAILNDEVVIDTAVVVRKVVGALTGGANSEVITHNLGTRDVTVVLRNNASPYDEIGPVYNEATSTNTITVYAAAGQNLPAGYRYVVIG